MLSVYQLTSRRWTLRLWPLPWDSSHVLTSVPQLFSEITCVTLSLWRNSRLKVEWLIHFGFCEGGFEDRFTLIHFILGFRETYIFQVILAFPWHLYQWICDTSHLNTSATWKPLFRPSWERKNLRLAPIFLSNRNKTTWENLFGTLCSLLSLTVFPASEGRVFLRFSGTMVHNKTI